jgi:hypothetical protein
MTNKLIAAVIFNILNFMDLAVTLVAFQMPHIDYTIVESNPLVIICYSELLAGNLIPFILLVVIKLIAVLLLTILWIRSDTGFVINLTLISMIFLYLIVVIDWIVRIIFI